MLSCRFAASITAFGRDAWNGCAACRLEDYDYLLGIESAGISGFSFGYFVVEDEAGPACTAPCFFVDYDLSTTARGLTATALKGVGRLAPRLLRLKLACLGSPETESCGIGFRSGMTEQERRLAFARVVLELETRSAERGIRLIGVKDLSEPDRVCLEAPLAASGFRRLASLPTAVLPIDFTSVDEYLSRLGSATRKDMRRKLKKRTTVEIAYCTNAADQLPLIVDMYRETRARGEMQFEELDEGYFREVLERKKENALCVVYSVGGQPAAANLLLIGDGRLVDKFFCMRQDIGREHNLYFLSWFVNVGLCLERKLSVFQSGQAAYGNKLRLGSLLVRNWIYYRHGNPLLHGALGLIAPLVEVKQPTERAG